MASGGMKMACCLCGVQITPNESYMCMNCLNTQVDLTEGLELSQDVLGCGKCGRFHVTGNQWKFMEEESPQLLTHLVKKIGLEKNRAKVLDAMFVWTEPHSKRLKVAVTIEKEVLDEKVRLSKRVVAEFVVKMKQCMECIRESTDHTWGSCVQIRQRVGHKRGFDQLEAILIAKGLQNLMLDVQVTKDGSFDLYFKSKNQGDRVIEAIASHMPLRKKESKKLVSTDKKNQTARMEYTTVLEIVPINKDDLVILKKTFTGGKPDFFLCNKVSTNLHFVAPGSTLQAVEVNATKYYQTPFSAVCTVKDLIRYIVLDINILEQPQPAHGGSKTAAGSPQSSVAGSLKEEADGATSVFSSSEFDGASKFVLAEAEIVRESSSGGADDIVTVVTHLGHLLKPGDMALGYNLSSSQIDDDVLATLPYALPECILVRKTTDDKSGKKKKKNNKKSRRGGGGKKADEEDDAETATGEFDDDEKAPLDIGENKEELLEIEDFEDDLDEIED